MPLWITVGILLIIFYLPWQVLIGFLLYPAYILRQTLEGINKVHLQTTHAEKSLAFYARLIQHIESGSFESEKLRKLQNTFLKDGQNASKSIKRLSYIIAQLNLRYNIFAIFFNLFALWDLRWVYRLEQWKAQHKKLLPVWFESLSEFEVLSSFGNLYYNNPEWVFPVFHNKPFFEANSLWQPLIRKESRFCNDLILPTNGHIKLNTRR